MEMSFRFLKSRNWKRYFCFETWATGLYSMIYLGSLGTSRISSSIQVIEAEDSNWYYHESLEIKGHSWGLDMIKQPIKTLGTKVLNEFPSLWYFVWVFFSIILGKWWSSRNSMQQMTKSLAFGLTAQPYLVFLSLQWMLVLFRDFYCCKETPWQKTS